MKKWIACFVILTITLCTLPVAQAQIMITNLVYSADFDRTTPAFEIGGAGDGRWYDITKSIYHSAPSSFYMDGRLETNSRIKFKQVLKNGTLTETDIGRKFKITCWLYVPSSALPLNGTTATIRVGMFGSGEFQTVPQVHKAITMPGNQWTQVSFDFTINAETVENEVNMLGFDQQTNYEFIPCLYIDDILVEEYIPAATGGEFTFDSYDLSNPTAAGSYMGDLSYTNTVTYGNSGRSLKIPDRTYDYNRIKFQKAFSNEGKLTKRDLGKTFRISCMVYLDDFYVIDPTTHAITSTPSNDGVTKVYFGIYGNSGGGSSSGEIERHAFTVPKQTWTQLDFIYTIEEHDVVNYEYAAVGIDQAFPTSDGIPGAKTMYVDDLKVEPAMSYVDLHIENEGNQYTATADVYYTTTYAEQTLFVLLAEYDAQGIMVNYSMSEIATFDADTLYPYYGAAQATLTVSNPEHTVTAFAWNSEEEMNPYTLPVTCTAAE